MQKEKVKLIIAIVGIVFAVYLIVKTVTPASKEVGFVVQCDKCSKAFKAEVLPTEGSFPMECKFCKEKSVYRLLSCKDCSRHFTYHSGQGTACPHCGSSNLDQPSQVPE